MNKLKKIPPFVKTGLWLMLTIVLLTFSCQNQNVKKKKESSSEEIIAKTPISFSEYVTVSGKKFIVHIDHSMGASICDVEVETMGFTEVNTTHKLGAINPVMDVFIADLDKNGFEEIYLVTQSAGSGSYGTIYGFSSNRDKSATPIYVRPVSEMQKEKGEVFEGYRGHNQFKMVNGILVNEFPKYLDNDNNANPNGGSSKVLYQLIPGEAGWILEPVTSKAE